MGYEFDDADIALIAKFRDAYEQYLKGHPMLHFLEESDVIDMGALLLSVIDHDKGQVNGTAKWLEKASK